jgi:hypothetical protein
MDGADLDDAFAGGVVLAVGAVPVSRQVRIVRDEDAAVAAERDTDNAVLRLLDDLCAVEEVDLGREALDVRGSG